MTRDELRQVVERFAYVHFETHEGEITPAQWLSFSQTVVETLVSDEIKAPEMEVEIAILNDRLLQGQREAVVLGITQAHAELLELFNTTPLEENEVAGFERAKAILKAVMS